MCNDCEGDDNYLCGCYGKCYTCGVDVNRGEHGWPCSDCKQWYCSNECHIGCNVECKNVIECEVCHKSFCLEDIYICVDCHVNMCSKCNPCNCY